MSIEGNLKDTPLTDILHIVNLGKKTGTLLLKQNQKIAIIAFKKGLILQTATNYMTGNLGELLIQENIVTFQQIKECLELQKTLSHKKLGELLIEKGYVKKDVLEAKLKKYIVRIISNLLQWDEGTFKFDYDTILGNPDNIKIGFRDIEIESGLSVSFVTNELGKLFNQKEEKKELVSEAVTVFVNKKKTKDIESKTQEEIKKLKEFISNLKPEEIPKYIMKCATDIVKRAALFTLSLTHAKGIAQINIFPDNSFYKIEDVFIPLDRNSIFKEVIKTGKTYIGKVGDTTGNINIVKELKVTSQTEVFVMPLIISKKVVMLIYGDNLPENNCIGNLETLEILAQHASKAIEVALLERKIKELEQKSTNAVLAYQGQKIVDKYLIEEKIGSGSYSEVFRCKEIIGGRTVAIKRMMIGEESSINVNIFINEISQMALLEQSQNILRYYTTEKAGNYLYVVTEYADGGSLKKLMQEEKVFSEDKALDIIKQILKGLYDAHKINIVHRDIKPANILIVKGIFKISDFGISRALTEKDVMMKTYIGSPRYMAPEQHRQECYGTNVDIYAVGLILYELLVGKHPFGKRFLPGPDEKIEFTSNISSPIRQIIMKALQYNPQLRYQNANEMISDIDSYLNLKRDSSENLIKKRKIFGNLWK